MRKIYCDGCGNETNNAFLLSPAGFDIRTTKGDRLKFVAEFRRIGGDLDKCDVCKHCLIDALAALDDRPKAG